MTKLRRAGSPSDDDSALMLMARQVLAMAECDGQQLGPIAAPTTIADAHAGARAKQTVTPATRRTVLRRDHGCCVVPGCRNAAFVDVHHVNPRSQGGRHEADNLITLCCVHHRAAHRGELMVAGMVSIGVRFQHADGSDYADTLAPRIVDVQTKEFAALRAEEF